MSKYTTTFRDVIDLGIYTQDDIESVFKDYNLLDYLTADEVAIVNARGTWTKEKLARKIFNHFYNIEIGFETFYEFSLQAKSYMSEIMEKYAPMIYSYSIEYDPLVNVDYTETFERTATSEDTASADGIVLNSDTPQGRVQKADILAGNYASNTSGNESSSNANSEQNESYTRTQKGNSGVSATAQALLKQYRDNIRAVDSEIIQDLKILFLGLF